MLRTLFAVFVFLFLLISHTVAFAQILPTDTSPVEAKDLEPLLERAKKDGLGVIVILPQGEVEEAEEAIAVSMRDQSLAVRAKIRDILGNAPNAWANSMQALRDASPDGTWWWLVIALATAGASLLAANFISWRFRVFNQKRFEHMYNPEPANRLEKISYLLFRASMIAFNILIMLATAFIVALIFDQGHEPSRATIFWIIAGYATYWFLRAVVFFNIIAHDLPNHRMVNLNDEDAKSMQYSWRNSMVAIIIAFCVCGWMRDLGLNEQTHKLFLVGAIIIAGIVLTYLVVRYRRQTRDIVLGAGDPATKPIWRRLAAVIVVPFLLAYLVVGMGYSAIRLLIDEPSPLVLVAAPSIAFVVGVGAYGLLLVLIDRYYLARERRFEARVAQALREREKQIEREAAAFKEARDEDGDLEETEQMIVNRISGEQDLSEMPAFKPVFKPLFESAAALVIFTIGLGFILGTWDVRAGERGNPITGFMDTLAILFIGWLAYRAMALYIDSKLEEEGPHDEDAHDDAGEGGGAGATRLQTLLPLVRNVVMVTIVVIIGMIILSNIGIDIAPLFAGAGVIGLAVGFGAQTLIRDIFSGGFFLFDDAFRKGEYIEVGDVRGVVEKISLRSFQLRHHNGPLHTLPFGEITQLTNYSRDWVIMKLPLRVTYDTDVERVRKLVKKLGQRLLENPDYGHLFLQPVKSQGVVQMEDSAIIIRVKFMTTPGNQWVLRKVVYAAVQDLFQSEGIKFAHKEVTVRIADDGNGHDHTEEERRREAASAAARSVVDEEAEKTAAAKAGKKEPLDF